MSIWAPRDSFPEPCGTQETRSADPGDAETDQPSEHHGYLDERYYLHATGSEDILSNNPDIKNQLFGCDFSELLQNPSLAPDFHGFDNLVEDPLDKASSLSTIFLSPNPLPDDLPIRPSLLNDGQSLLSSSQTFPTPDLSSATSLEDTISCQEQPECRDWRPLRIGEESSPASYFQVVTDQVQERVHFSRTPQAGLESVNPRDLDLNLQGLRTSRDYSVSQTTADVSSIQQDKIPVANLETSGTHLHASKDREKHPSKKSRVGLPRTSTNFRAAASKTSPSSSLSKATNSNFTLEHGQRKFRLDKSRARRSFDNDRRKEVETTRKNGACFQCRWSKTECRPSTVPGVCENCHRRDRNLDSLCFRLNLEDCAWFRTSSCLQSAPLPKKRTWSDPYTVTLMLTTMPSADAPRLFIECRKFRLVATNMVDASVRREDNGAFKDTSTSAAIGLTSERNEICAKILLFVEPYIDVMAADGTSELAIRILQGARKYALQHPKSLVNAALGLWACSRMYAQERLLEGNETLGQEKVKNPLSPQLQRTPIPLMLDYQCDLVTIEWMENAGEGVFKILWTKLQKKNRGDWFEVFLTTFIMVHNIEFVCGVEKQLAYLYGLNATNELSQPVRKPVADWPGNWSLSAQRLLHVYKTFFKSGYPFSNQALVDTAKRLNQDELLQSLIAYLQKCHGKIEKRDTRTMKDDDFNYEMFWAWQIFRED